MSFCSMVLYEDRIAEPIASVVVVFVAAAFAECFHFDLLVPVFVLGDNFGIIEADYFFLFAHAFNSVLNE